MKKEGGDRKGKEEREWGEEKSLESDCECDD